LAIWRQVSRYFYGATSPADPNDRNELSFGDSVLAADMDNDVDAMRRFAAALPLREVDEKCNPIYRASARLAATGTFEGFVKDANGNRSTQQFSCNGGIVDEATASRLGSLFPNSPNLRAG
jgi:hypothetical protein